MTNTKTKSEGSANYTVQIHMNGRWMNLEGDLTFNEARAVKGNAELHRDKARIVTDSGLIVE